MQKKVIDLAGDTIKSQAQCPIQKTVCNGMRGKDRTCASHFNLSYATFMLVLWQHGMHALPELLSGKISCITCHIHVK